MFAGMFDCAVSFCPQHPPQCALALPTKHLPFVLLMLGQRGLDALERQSRPIRNRLRRAEGSILALQEVANLCPCGQDLRELCRLAQIKSFIADRGPRLVLCHLEPDWGMLPAVITFGVDQGEERSILPRGLLAAHFPSA